MGQDGIMYLAIDDPKVVNILGEVVTNGPLHREEIPPIPIQLNLRLVDSIWARRVFIDDETQALYKR